MTFKITKSITYLLGISLENPFPLGFGTLNQLPRVLFLLQAKDGIRQIEGVGESSIDFPFINYDAWDIYDVLSKVDLKDRKVNDREKILNDEQLNENLLEKFPSAFAALNMALDDLFGKANNLSIQDIYGRQREGGKALASISFKNNTEDLLDEVKLRLRTGFVPKIKAGEDLKKDFEVFSTLNKLINDNQIPSYAIDFNARYSTQEFEGLISNLLNINYKFKNALFIEQPTRKEAGITGLKNVKSFLYSRGITTSVLADESFVSITDAIDCAKNGILLNFKIQKIGGAYQARRIEDRLNQIHKLISDYPSTVGGTFPTAIGRTYDQHCASILKYASLPSDSWEPSTDWFRDEKHLIEEEFSYDHVHRLYLPMHGFGLGITVNWKKITPFILNNPQKEYLNIRQGFPGEKIMINLREGKSYKDTYEALAGKPWNWNLK